MKSVSRLLIVSFICAGVSSCTSCPAPTGITVPATDSTAPTLTLGVRQSGAPQSASVSSGGSFARMSIWTKTAPLNLMVNATDPESGIQAVEIWVGKKLTICNPACTTLGTGLPSAATFQSTEPVKPAGQTTVASRSFDQPLEMAQEIPQTAVPAGNSLEATFYIYAVAVNNLGQRARSPYIVAKWADPLTPASHHICATVAGGPSVTTVSPDVITVGQQPGRRTIAYRLNPTGPDAVLILVDDAPDLTPDQMRVEIDIDPNNGVTWAKSIEAWRSCRTAPRAGVIEASMIGGVNVGTACFDLDPSKDWRSGCTQSQTMLLDRSTTDELWFRKGGFAGVWTDAGAIDSSMWRAFGGRSVRFIWRFN